MITRNAPVRGHADDVTLTAAPPRTMRRPIESDAPTTILGIPRIAFVAVVAISLFVVGCMVIVGLKAVSR